MITALNTQWLLRARPSGGPEESNFEWRTAPLAALADGQVLVRVIYISIDPTNRVWMNDAPSYLPKLELGEVMRAIALGRVEDSRHADFAPGDIVQGMLGWQSHAVCDARDLRKLPPLPLPLTAHFGLLGHIGLTAYFGLVEVGQAKAGETLTVSAAAGAVGSLACQIGKILGMRVVGIAGGAEKCRWLTDELGADASIEYKTEDVATALGRACAAGIDVAFENVGGRILDAALGHINLHARIVLCGMISQYAARRPAAGLVNLGNLISRRARMEGFIVLDYLDRANEAARRLVAWHMEGRLKYRVHVVEGLENAPRALGMLFDGANTGKLLVKVSEE